MKYSWILAGVILAAGGLWGWSDYSRLTLVRENQRRLEEQALGLDPAGESLRDERTLSSGRARGDEADRAAQAKAFVVKLIAFAKDMEAGEKGSSRMSEEEREKRLLETLNEMFRLDASQLKILITELRADSQLGEDMKRGVISFTITMLANDHPAAALAVVAESRDLFEGKGDGGQVVASALSRWAQDDPSAALAWMRANAESHPEWVTEQTKRGLITGAARQNPKLAIQLAAELGLTKFDSVARELVTNVPPEARMELLDALRDQTPGATDVKVRDAMQNDVLKELARQVCADGFEYSRAWLDKAALTESEVGTFFEGLSMSQTGKDTGQWIEWLADKLPGEVRKVKTYQLVAQWTRDDYQAAGEWLNITADGPTKQAAVRSYAETVAPHDPETAAQWAVTLPAGVVRNRVIKRVRDVWKKKDEAAAAEFARKNGM
jgi:hypothetical protein